MGFSVIIPARNAEATLAATLDSIVSQTHDLWEVIVVNDGSTDRTGEIAHDYAKSDPRISVRDIRHRGVSSARNEGLRAARYEWVLFLDADDWVSPVYLERVHEKVSADPELGAVYSNWEFVNPDGQAWRFPASRLDPTDLFPVLARHCPFTMHSCIVSTDLARDVGGFDAHLTHAQDWDFWQRIARTDTKFGSIPDVLAFYRVGHRSASIAGSRVLRDNAKVLARGHSQDRRVRNPIARYANGMPRARMRSAFLSLVAWHAGLLIGQKRDSRPLVRNARALDATDVDGEGIAWSLYLAVPRSRGLPPNEWAPFYSDDLPGIEAFLERLERRIKVPGTSRFVRNLLEDLVLSGRNTVEPARAGRTYAVTIPVEEKIPDIRPPAGVERVWFRVQCKGHVLGRLLLPVCDEWVPAPIIADTIATNYCWVILGLFFQQHIYPLCRISQSSDEAMIWRGDVLLGSTGPTGTETSSDDTHDRIGWVVFLQELWGHGDWPQDHFYDSEAAADSPERIEPAKGGAGLRIEVSRPLADLRAAGSGIEALIITAGIPLGRVWLPAVAGTLKAGAIRAAIISSIGPELIRGVVREAVIGRPFDEEPCDIRSRLSALEEARRPRGGQTVTAGVSDIWPFEDVLGCLPELTDQRSVMIGRRDPYVYFGGDIRRVRLPIASQDTVVRAAISSGRPCLCTSGDSAGPPVLISTPELIAAPEPRPMGEAELVDPDEPPAGEDARTVALPILAYQHGMSIGCDGDLQHPVTPRQFERSMRRLHELGYRSVKLSEWAAAMWRRQPISGRGIIITIDGFDVDLLEHAWSTLKRFGLSATLFFRPEEVEPARRLRNLFTFGKAFRASGRLQTLLREGLEIGSLCSPQRPLAWLSHLELVREGGRLLEHLIKHSAVSLPAIAYSTGGTNPIVEHLVAACGYSLGLTTDARLCTFTDRSMALPRYAITGATSEREFDEILMSVIQAGS